MIRDLSLSLQAILDDTALAAAFPELAAAQVVFDRPSDTFNPTQTTIDVFLYDLREDLELRTSETQYERVNGQTRIHRGPLRVICTYLITAWPVGGTDLALQEHRLLSQVLQVLARNPHIPPPFLRGQLIGQEPALPMITARASGIKEPAEFWTAIGNRLRPSITTTVTISMEVFPVITAPTVITEEIRLGERTGPEAKTIDPATLTTRFRIGGRVHTAANAPIANATVRLVDTGLSAITDADGQYVLGTLRAGTYTLRVQSGAATVDFAITVPTTTGNRYDVQM
jgi:hypothetical protein